MEELPENNFNSVNLVDLIDQPAWKTILIDLVKKEQMDPWAIDVVGLADKYLQKIQSMEKADLRVPANAILASAILLKLKARTLKLSSIDEEDITEELSEEEIRQIEESIPELRSIKSMREGSVSLNELVSGIEAILEKTKVSKRLRLEFDQVEFKVAFSSENIDEKIENVYHKILERADSQGLVTFSMLLDEKTPLEMVNAFIPLLFLMNKGKINAWQEQWFGEIMISIVK